MKFVGIIFLLVCIGIIATLPNVFAIWPFDPPATAEPAKGMIRTENSIIYYDLNKKTGSWQSAPDWILNYVDYQGNPIYVPYNLWEGSNYITIENAQTSVVVNKDSCTLSLFDGGRVNGTELPLIENVGFNLQQATNGTDIWNQSDSNSQQCNVTYQKQDNGVIVNLKQGGTIEKNIELRIFDTHVPEMVLKVKNNGQDSTQKYGYAVTLSNSSNISTDGDFIDFKNGLGKTVFEFNTQNSINNYLWKIKNVNDGVILDYKYAKGPLLPGQTLEIDPTFSVLSSHKNVASTSAANGAACPNTQNGFPGTYVVAGHSSGSGLGCYYVGEKYDISTFPHTAVISSVQVKAVVASGGSGGTLDCIIRAFFTDPATDSAQQFLNDAQNGTTYSASGYCTNAPGTFTINLGNQAITDFKSQYLVNFFAIGVGPVPEQIQAADPTRAFTNSTLLVNYTLPVPNAVTNLSCSPTQALGNKCTWTNATSTGGKVQGFYTTRNGTAEPLFSTNLIGYWKMDGLSLTNKMIDYSATLNNGTVTGTFVNKTGTIFAAMNFSGSNYVTMPNNAAYNFNATVPTSFSFWGTGNEAAANEMFISKGQFGTGAGSFLYKDTFGRLVLTYNRNGFTNQLNYNCTPSGLNSNALHLYTVTYDGTGSATAMKCYKDGISVTSTRATNTLNGTATNSASLIIGASTGGSNILKGMMDDVRIYNRVLAPNEVLTLAGYTQNTALSKLDTYLLHDGKTYRYCVYSVNQYGQNDTGTCTTATAKNYASPPQQLNGKFFKDGTNTYKVQLNWNQPPQFLSDNFLATGYKLQKLEGASWVTLLNNSTLTTYTDSSLQNTTTQKYRLFSNNHLGTSPGYSFVNTNGTGLKTLYQFENNTVDGRGTNTVAFTRSDNYTSGFIGYALALNGTQYGKSTATGIPNGTSDRTFSLWIKPVSFSAASVSNSYLSTGSSSGNGMFAIIDSNGKIDCGGSGNNVNTTATLTANHWALITCVLSNSGQTRSIYINGSLDKSSTTTAINSAATSLYIGTRSDNSNKNVTSLIDNVRVYNTALNSTFVSELFNEAITSKDNANIAGTHTLTFVTVGDVTRATSHLTITSGFPPATVTNWHLYNFSTVYNSTNVSTSMVSGIPASFLYGNYFNVDVVHNFKAVARVSNGTTTTLINSTVYPILFSYLPTYKTSSGILYNFTFTRPAPATNLTLFANENPILFNMSCQIQAAADAAAGSNNGWYNHTSVGYFLQSIIVHNYDNMYGTCYKPGNTKLFTFISYGNSSIFPAINFMNQSYGAYVGVPIGVVFIVMAAALGNRRTAPMWVVIILAIAGIMSTVAFFTLNSGVWALALIAGLLALFVGRKVT